MGSELDVADISRSEFRREVRGGPKGMPAFREEILGDEDLEAIYAFLQWAGQKEAAKTVEAGVNP